MAWRMPRRTVTVGARGYEHVVDMGAPMADGSTGTLLTTLDNDPYGRDGTGPLVTLDLGGAILVSEIVIRVTAVNEYLPPSSLAESFANDEDARWGISQMERNHSGFFDYVHPTMGTWNVGLTHAAFRQASGTIVSEAVVRASTVTTTGEFGGELFEVESFAQSVSQRGRQAFYKRPGRVHTQIVVLQRSFTIARHRCGVPEWRDSCGFAEWMRLLASTPGRR